MKNNFGTESISSNKLTKSYIESCSYTDFVGLINQTNVPPGAYSTLSKWINYSNLDASSNVLELACTTGFSIREISNMTSCSGVGIDISENSIAAARMNKSHFASDKRITYECVDGYQYKPDSQFSHIILGASLKFFPEPRKMLENCLGYLGEGGYFLASPFYVKSPIPNELLLEAQETFNITPTTQTYKDVMSLYKGLDVWYEERCEIESETNSELEHYCQSTVSRFFKNMNIKDDGLYDVSCRRLYKIKLMSNKLRPYQRYSVLVLKYTAGTYPSRFVELF